MPVEKFENWLIFGIIDMDNSLQLTFGPPFIQTAARLSIKRSRVRLPAWVLSSHLGQLSLPSLRGTLIEYPGWGYGGVCSLVSGGK